MAVAVLFAAAPARAAGSKMDWSGPYVGVNGGYGWGSASTSFPGDGDVDGLFGTGGGTPGEPPDGGFNQSLRREAYGVQAGFNLPVWRDFVAGFEVTYDQANIQANSENYLPPVGYPGTERSATLRVKSLLALTPQVGFAFDRLLLRAKGGLAAGRVQSRLYTTAYDGNPPGSPGPATFEEDSARLGWTVGAGADYALTDHWILGLEYDYVDLGKFQYGGETTPDAWWPASYEVHPILRTATARLSYKFGGEASSAGGFRLFDSEAGGGAVDWSGPYVGIDGGYGWGRASTSFDGDGDADGLFANGTGADGEPPLGGIDQSLRRELYGIHAGYDVAVWRNVYAGFEAEYDQANVQARSDNYLASVNFPGSNTSAVLRVNSLFSFAPQVGWGLGRFLLRAKGGVAGGRAVSHLYSSTDNNTGAGPTTFGQDQTRFGWTWGLGADYALTDHWILGLAFDYYDLGTFRYGGLTAPDTNWPLSYAVHPILRAATLRLSYKFGGEAAPERPRERERAAAPADIPPAAAPEAPVLPAAASVAESDADPATALILSLKTGDDAARAEAAIRLGELRSGRAVEPLIAALSDKAPVVRGAAANALGKLGSSRAALPLCALLRDPRPKVRALAARALGALGDPRALAPLRAAAGHDADPLVRRFANAALKQLAQPRGQTIDDLLRTE